MAHARYTSPGFLCLAGFTAAYLVASAFGAWAVGNGEFVFYIAVMLVLIGAVLGIDRRVGFSPALMWCLTTWGAIHMAGGLVPVPEAWPINGDQRVLYSWWIVTFATASEGIVTYGIKYDQLTHAFGFGVTAWACWQGLVRTIRSARAEDQRNSEIDEWVEPTLGRLTLCFTAAMGFGALNEVVEFIATRLGPTNVGGYTNTGYDLIANGVGALIAVVMIRYRAQNRNATT